MKTLAKYAEERRGLKVITTHKVPSKTTKGVEYTVSIDIFGNIFCDCPSVKVCSHIKLIKYKYGKQKSN